MAAEGWVRVPAAHAKAGPGFELQNLWGSRTGNPFWDFDRNGRANGADEVLRYQMPDGSMRMRDSNGKGPSTDSKGNTKFKYKDYPAWAPPARPAVQPSAAQPPARPAVQPSAAQPPARPAVQAPTAQPPAAPVLPPPAAPAASAAPGDASLDHASAVISGLQQRFGAAPLVPEDARFSAQETPQLQQTAANLTAGGGANRGAVISDDELNRQRRAAFLNSSDSMSGLKAVRGLLSEQAKARGADISGGGSIPAMKFLEAQLAGKPVKGGESSGLSPSQIAQTGFEAKEQVVPSDAPRAAVNGYMQTALKEKLQASQQPLDQIAQWQLTPQPIQAPRVDPGREAMLAAFAARGEKPPTTEGEAVLAAGAGNPFGTRGGQFKPGNTVNLGFFDASALPELNSSGFYSGARLSSNPGNLF